MRDTDIHNEKSIQGTETFYMTLNISTENTEGFAQEVDNLLDVNSIKVETSVHSCINEKKDDFKSGYANNVEVKEDNICTNGCQLDEKDFISITNKYTTDKRCTEDAHLPTQDEYFNQRNIFWGCADNSYSAPLFKCPKCGGIVRKNLTFVLTTHPPQYQYECSTCDYVTTGF